MIDEAKFKLHCVRVVISKEGKAVSPTTAREEFGLTPTIVFIRNDGWRLGAPQEFEQDAYNLWKDTWTHYQRRGALMRPISEYEKE